MSLSRWVRASRHPPDRIGRSAEHRHRGLPRGKRCGLLPDTIDAKRTRIRHHAATPDDLAWIRAVPSNVGAPYRCDCRCHCHSAGTGMQPSVTSAPRGSCGLELDLLTLDCSRTCRASHILASDCHLDETRGEGSGYGTHV